LIGDGRLEPGAIVIVGCCNLIPENGRYLFVRESKASARSRFNLPAGKPECGETLIEAAVREAREGTGPSITSSGSTTARGPAKARVALPG
jgi:ADP-ribose pyrophosphatase YjhB (NUDIX family)